MATLPHVVTTGVPALLDRMACTAAGAREEGEEGQQATYWASYPGRRRKGTGKGCWSAVAATCKHIVDPGGRWRL